MLVAALFCATLAPTAAVAATSARAMYESARSRETAVRAQWGPGGQRELAGATIRKARAVALAYEAVVRRYPASGYCDNALWQAAILEADLFERGQQESDRQKAMRLFEFLAREYPASPLARKATAEARKLQPSPTAAAAADRSAPRTRAAGSTRDADASRPARTDRPAKDLPAKPTALSERAAASPEPAKRPAQLSTIRQITRTILPEIVRVTIELDNEVPYHAERVENPARLLFDLSSTRATGGLQDANWTYADDVVRRIRVGQHPNQSTRVVLDLDGVNRYSVVTLFNPYRILIDCERTAAPVSGSAPGSAPAASRSPHATPGSPSPAAGSSRPIARSGLQRGVSQAGSAGGDEPAGASGLKDRNLPEQRGDAVSQPASPPQPGEGSGLQPGTMARNVAGGEPESRKGTPAAQAKTAQAWAETAGEERPKRSEPAEKPAEGASRSTTSNGMSMARQLGLGISRIVIDPGHGGHDPGAEGPHTSEADVVLDIALRLEALLARQPGVDVVLTRRTDVFVPLEERTAIANREQADLFLSIHANASRNKNARGIESYYLNFAANPDAEAVAARENAASERTMSNLNDIIKAIALHNKVDESKDFAGFVQQSMAKRLRASNRSLKDLGVKHAPFVVLVGAGMPSVLAEVSFLTNRGEEQLLRSEEYRQRIAEALCDAIVRYKRTLKNADVVAGQQY